MARTIDRRQFLRLSGVSAVVPSGASRSFASLLQAGAGGRGNPVVVVGAGLAGLRAAALLQKAGRHVVVLEARPYPGGRVLTLRNPFDDGLYAEAGPIRIPAAHGSVVRLVRELGLILVPFEPPNGFSLVTAGGVSTRSSDELARTPLGLSLAPSERGLAPRTLLERYVGDLPTDFADPAPTAASYARWQVYDRLSWPEWLRSRGASPGAVKLMTLGGDSSDLSALYVLRQFALLPASTRSFKIQGGMDRLPRAMAAALGDVVRYNAQVVRIDRRSPRLRIDCLEHGRMTSVLASAVILALPFSTLRRIEVRPPFSGQKERAIEDLPYFPATRILLQSRRRFWRASGLSGSARTDRPAEIWDCTYDLPRTRGILGATAGGAVGRAMLTMSPEECLALGQGIVADAFPNIRADFEKGVVHRWALEPWSRGAFAVFHPGQMSSMMPHISRPEGRIHFAGEHTSAWMGWMEGALQSGERAAAEVLASS